MGIDELKLKTQKVTGNCITKEDFIKMLDGMKFHFVENAYLNLITGIIIDTNNENIEILRNKIDFNKGVINE